MTYYKELAQMIWSLISKICKLETQESRWGSSGPKAIDRLKTQEKSVFPFKSESWKKLMSKFEVSLKKEVSTDNFNANQG